MLIEEPNMFHNYETEKITHKVSDAAENLQLQRVVRSFRPRSSSHDAYICGHSENNIWRAGCSQLEYDGIH